MTEKSSNNLADHLNSPQRHQERVRAARRDALLDIDASPRRRRVSNQNTREFRSINNGSSAIHDALGAEKRQLRDNRRAGDATLPDSPRRLRRSIRLSGVVSGGTQPPERYQNPDDPFLDTTTNERTDVVPPALSARSVAQRLRRARERAEKAQSLATEENRDQNTQNSDENSFAQEFAPQRTLSVREIAQRRRKERARAKVTQQVELRNEPGPSIYRRQDNFDVQLQQPTPPLTQQSQALSRERPQHSRQRDHRQDPRARPAEALQQHQIPPGSPPRLQLGSNRGDDGADLQHRPPTPITQPRQQQRQQTRDQSIDNPQDPPGRARRPRRNRQAIHNQNQQQGLAQNNGANVLPHEDSRGPSYAARIPYRDPAARHDLGRMDVPCPYCKALHWMAEKTANSSRTAPKFGACCDHGQVRLPFLTRPPDPLCQLLLEDTARANEFRENISQYNSALAFTSLGVDIDRSINKDGRGPPVFRIHGELRHLSGALCPRPPTAPAYAQLYIYDPHEALHYRMLRNDKLQEDTMQILQTMLHDSNPYVAIYQHAHEVLQQHPEIEDYRVRLRVAPGRDRRRWNLPTADEVAVILPGDGTEVVDHRDIILRTRDGALQRVHEGHAAYSPLHYVLLFPRGEPGWHWEMTMHQPDRPAPHRLSQTRFAAFRLHPRPDDVEFSTVLRGGRLLQRWMVDMWAIADQNRLNYLRQNQKKLRAELYNGLEDAVAGDGDVDLHNLGQRFILPSSYIGGPRNMHQRFQDSMAIARYYKRIDLFITVTANPEWPEIQRELLPGQSAYDRPDLISRVFEIKKRAILDDIYKNGIFGRAVAFIFVIEFQKRCLPHMHLMIILQDRDSLRTPADVDSCISAQWPDPDREPLLFEVVQHCMIHGPCGALNRNSPCMEENRCTKHYPKEFQAQTTMDEEGYPRYARPDDGRSFEVRKHRLDNRWIVPYNPYLSAKYYCHINVECAVSFHSVKYAFKYIHKGGDRGSLQVENRDEIKHFLDGRYVSAAESAWRIFHFDTHDRFPNVVQLQVHLPGQHLVTFDPDEDHEVVMERAANEKTTLTAFFALNTDNGPLGAIARQYTYQEFPEHFVYKKPNKCWSERHQRFAIGRMVYIPPNAGERFYLRTLLIVARGPKSFQDLRTVDGVVHPTFREACLARGLLEDDGEWRKCLEDASVMQTGVRLRFLFATILLWCYPGEPHVLWQDFRHHICDDLAYRLRMLGRRNPTDEEVYDYGLFLLDKILRRSGRTLAEYPNMPLPQENWDIHVENPLILEQTNYNQDNERTQAEARVAQMNEDQTAAYAKIMDSVENRSGKLFFLDGYGGTGKTFVYNTVAHSVRAQALVVLCVASTGISSLLLQGGRTAYSVFKIPVEGLTAESMCAIPKQSFRADLIRATSIILWDEITMQNKLAPEAVDRTCRDIRDDPRPFGGITVVFGGDFQQILPVVVKGSREDIIGASIQRSYLWPQIEILKLRRNMRLEQTPEEREFGEWLLDVGHGRGIAPDNTIALPTHMRVENVNSLIQFIYPDVTPELAPPPPNYFLERFILCPRNNDVDAINRTVLSRLAGEEHLFVSADSIEDRNGEDGGIPAEYLHTLSASGLPPGLLTLKIGCPLILLRNLDPSRGLCNGTRMVLRRMSPRVLEVRILGGDHDGEIAFIPRIGVRPSDKSANLPFELKRVQFPLCLAFAITINKSQGQSARYVGLDLSVPVFSHGQLYVALSRATSGQRVKVLLPEDTAEPRTANIVYDEVLFD